jgi:citrate lyase subunit beta/citryl-CoA lyase
MIRVPDWQALLFVPVGAERHLASAIRLRPDAIILDLEDAIAPAAKPEARAKLRAAQRRIHDAGIDCVIRINGPLRDMLGDIAAADLGRVAALMVPKVEGLRALENVAELTGGKVGQIALIETPAALASLPGIAAFPQVVALMLGSEDYSASLGVSPDGGALTHLAAQIGVAAAPRGLLAIGFPGSLANFHALDLYADQIALGRQLGLRAVAAIHPAQLPVIRTALTPTMAEVTWATKVLETQRDMEGAVIALDGTMIDAPVVLRARNILKLVQHQPIPETSGA